MKATLIDYMGSDLTVVNAARVSFAKKSEWDDQSYEVSPGAYEAKVHLKEADSKLIKYLAKHNHWTPFGHPQIQFHVKAPIFVARQLGKHQVGMVWNEISRRYVASAPEFYEPSEWRKRADNIKQGSSEEVLDLSRYECNKVPTLPDDPAFAFYSLEEALWELGVIYKRTYESLLGAGVCPEQARMVLPQSMYTEWYWTGSLAAWARVCKLRLDSHTQKETRELAQQFSDIIETLFPVSWAALIKD